MKKNILFFLLIPYLLTAQNSLNMNILGEYNYSTTKGNDIWGWVDSSSNEYALVGLRSGFSVVNVTNPTNPIEEFYISDLNSTWRDIKTWGNYAYVTTEANAGLLIVDLTDMTGNTYWHITQFIDTNNNSIGFTSAHNLYIDENGIAYIFGARNSGSLVADGGVIFLDVAANPTNPVYLGEWDEAYIHDGMARGDTLYVGCIYAGELVIIDVSDKSNPITLGAKTTPDAFTHNGWVSDNGDYVFTTDEKSDAYLTAYDVTDVNNIQEVDRIQSNPGSLSIPHNTHVDGNFLITSYYRDGTTVHDITYPNNMIQVAYYDSYSGSGNGFDGCWGTYPFLPSGNIISSEINSSSGNGQLLIYGRDFQQACYLKGNIIDCISSLPINNAIIEILNTVISENTNLLGDFQTAVIDSGVYDIVISASGYLTDTFNVTLSNGVMTILDTVLCPLGITYGCTDSLALNYDPNALIDDGSCCYVSGCTDPLAINYDSLACYDDGSCIIPILGCTDSLACNYDSIANIDDSSCIYLFTEAGLEFNNGIPSHVTCNGLNNGTAFAFAIGGTPPYTFVWDSINGQTGQNATNLTPGIHTVYVTDAGGCTASDTMLITQPDSLKVVIDSSMIIYPYCLNTHSGQLCAIASGGTEPYNYIWDDILAQTTPCAYNLNAGIYTVTVKDKRDCIASVSYDLDSITNTMTASGVSMTIDSVSCWDGFDGKVSITNVTGGVAAYDYAWTGPGGYTSSDSSISSLTHGSYSCAITDTNGCVITINAEVGQPDKLWYTTTNVVGSTCDGACNGQIWVDVTGGLPPYYFDVDETGSFPFVNTQMLVNDSMILNLCQGDHEVYVTDQNNCIGHLFLGGTWQEFVDTGIVVSTSSIFGQNQTSPFSFDSYHVTQHIGSTFNWILDNGGVITAGQATDSIQVQWGSIVGSFNLYVIETDSNGCTGDTISLTINVSAISSIENNSSSLGKELIRITDLLGRKTKVVPNIPLFYIYSDGTVEKRVIIKNNIFLE